MAKRAGARSGWPELPGLPLHWQNFIAGVGFLVVLPLIPLLLELCITRKVSDISVALAAAMYPIGLGVCSRNLAVFVYSVVVMLTFSCFFGVVTYAEFLRERDASRLKESRQDHARSEQSKIEGEPRQEIIPFLRWGAGLAIALAAVWHVGERYNRHVVDCARFFDFSLR